MMCNYQLPSHALLSHVTSIKMLFGIQVPTYSDTPFKWITKMLNWRTVHPLTKAFFMISVLILKWPRPITKNLRKTSSKSSSRSWNFSGCAWPKSKPLTFFRTTNISNTWSRPKSRTMNSHLAIKSVTSLIYVLGLISSTLALSKVLNYSNTPVRIGSAMHLKIPCRGFTAFRFLKSSSSKSTYTSEKKP